MWPLDSAGNCWRDETRHTEESLATHSSPGPGLMGCCTDRTKATAGQNHPTESCHGLTRAAKQEYFLLSLMLSVYSHYPRYYPDFALGGSNNVRKLGATLTLTSQHRSRHIVETLICDKRMNPYDELRIMQQFKKMCKENF